MSSSYAIKAIEPINLVEGHFDLHVHVVGFVLGDVEQAVLSKVVFY